MKHSIKLSIIVPVYNVEKYVEKCIKSLLVPGLYNYEILVVNDGTPDKSIDIIRKCIHDERVQIIEKENGGLSSARNYGIKHAKGDYVWCFDSDDWAETQLIGQVIKMLDGADCLYFSSHYINYENSNRQEVRTRRNEAKTGKELACKGFWLPTQFYVLRRHFLVSNNLYYTEGILHEDALFTSMMIPLSDRVVHCGLIVYHYRQRDGSIMHSKVTAKRLYDLIYVLKELTEYGETNSIKEIKYKWGNGSITPMTLELLFLSQQCTNEEACLVVKNYVNRNWKLLMYLFHSRWKNKLLSVISYITLGNLYEVFTFLYKFKPNAVN